MISPAHVFLTNVKPFRISSMTNSISPPQTSSQGSLSPGEFFDTFSIFNP